MVKTKNMKEVSKAFYIVVHASITTVSIILCGRYTFSSNTLVLLCTNVYFPAHTDLPYGEEDDLDGEDDEDDLEGG